MSSQSNFNVENIIGRDSTIHQVFQEFSHICRNEYTVSRALCMSCLRAEECRFISRNQIPTKCTCEEIPAYVTEQCIHCAEIKEEITFLKNEIRRTSTMYGIEVAETLEMNPLFLQTIEKLVFRVQVLEQVLLHQLIRTETAECNAQADDSMSEESTLVDDAGNMEDDEDNDAEDEEQPDTDDDDAEIESITRDVDQIDIAETESLDNGNRKRKRPESPELWLYDGNMV
jgi:hypothetical protein